MVDVDIPRDEIVDPPALRAGPDFPWYDRSRCRTPMQWSDGAGAGFTTGRPWLRLAPDADTRNVAAQAADPDSVLACYRRLLDYRRGSSPLQRGDMTLLDSGTSDVVAWLREVDGERVLVVVSFVGEPRTVDLARATGSAAWRSWVGTAREPARPDAAGHLALGPDEALILEAAGG
jgi:alpha-glucosidase